MAAPDGAKPGSKAWADFNEAAIHKFSTETLQPCPHCARTFLPDRLKVHLRSCGQGHFADPKLRPAGGTADEAVPRTTQGTAFPSPQLSVASGKLGALARQRSGGVGGSALPSEEEAEQFFESARENRTVRHTSSDDIRQRQAAPSDAIRQPPPRSPHRPPCRPAG